MITLCLPNDQVNKGSLILVNREHAYSAAKDNGEPLIPVWKPFASILLEEKVAKRLNQLMLGINGWKSIVPISGWRSIKEQQNIWNQSMEDRKQEFTETYVAIPGHSEHHTGLAIDLGLKGNHIDPICPDFPYSGICQLFRQKASKYGFVERYMAGKEHITGIGHEPWHFRYVGVPHAEIMNTYDFVLEEYLAFIKQFPYPKKSYYMVLGKQELWIGYLQADPSGTTKLEIDPSMPFAISGNNMDGYLITQWRM